MHRLRCFYRYRCRPLTLPYTSYTPFLKLTIYTLTFQQRPRFTSRDSAVGVPSGCFEPKETFTTNTGLLCTYKSNG